MYNLQIIMACPTVKNIQYITLLRKMRNFDPLAHSRAKWTDPNRTKHNPVPCSKAHTFCNFEYQWGDDSKKIKSINQPYLNESAMADVILPDPQEKNININYQSITEEDLDDWVAQSLNRTIASMLNPQKKFSLNSKFQQQLKVRYRGKRRPPKVTEDETYFDRNSRRKKVKGYLSNERRKKISIAELFFDYRRLEPQRKMAGTPIKERQMADTAKKQIKRRNAVLLDNDIHYTRFQKEFKKERQSIGTSKKKEQQKQPVIKKDMLYSYNIESMKRKTSYDDVPNSIIQKEFHRIRAPQQDFLTSHRALINNQEELHEKYRLLMNQNTKNAIEAIKQMTLGQKAKQREPYTSSNTRPIIKKQISNLRAVKLATKDGLSQKDDKKARQGRVMKLLNDMQVQSENIDDNMAKLNIHANIIPQKRSDSRPQGKWIMKAEQKVRAGQNDLAIDCYKQSIIIEPDHFLPVYNIAVLLEKSNMLQSARLWFNLAGQFKVNDEPTDHKLVLLGKSIVAMKQLRFNESLACIKQLIENLNEDKFKIEPVHRYIKALCEKELGMQAEAKIDYDLISHEIKPSNYNVLSNFIFSVVFHRMRRIALKFNCLSYMMFRETLYVILYEPTKKIKDESESITEIGQKLVKEPFFNRFSLTLINKLLKLATYQEKQKDSIIFTSKNQTSIILNGLVSLKSHEKDFIRPDLVSVMGRGGIIGAGKLDNHISEKPNSWFTAMSNVELITIPRDQFYLFWKGQITFDMDFKFNYLRNIALFKGLSQSTIFNLCQLLEKKIYEKGTILFNDCSYRNELINNQGKGFGLGKPTQHTDPRFILFNNSSFLDSDSKKKEERGRCRIYQLMRKHIFKFNQMKFNRLKYPGLFIVLKGKIQIQDDLGFRCSDIIGERDYFGQNLLIESDGYHNYGRMVVESEKVEVYLLDIQKMIWVFNEDDKQRMKKNCQNRKSVQTIKFLRNQFKQCQNIKMQCRLNPKN